MRHNLTVLKGRPYPLGVTVTGEMEVNFAAVCKGEKECGVILYPVDGRGSIRLPFPEEGRVGDVSCMKISGIRMEEYEYNFYMGKKPVTDPYARSISGNEKWGKRVDPQLRGREVADSFDWGEDVCPKTPLCDSILYLLHVRGFTRHSSSEVTHKGTFMGLTEKIPYLKELGITAVELMPAYEFTELARDKSREARVPENSAYARPAPADEEKPRLNYWGFKEGYYFAPKASYCSTDQPADEMKRMVKSLHQNGLEVIMQFYFPGEVKRSLIPEVLKYWVCEYHIDGFHLLGEQLPVSLLATDPVLTATKLFYYEFPCSEIYKAGETPAYKNLACYRDDFLYDMRSFLKGDEDTLGKVLYQLKKNPAQTGVINYMANYEGYSLADLVTYERRHNEANGEDNRDGNPCNVSWNCGAEGKTRRKGILQLRARQLRNAVLLLLFAQGTPMLVAGDEFGHTREGNNNPYCQDNAVNWLNWKQTKTNDSFLAFVRAAIGLRKAHPILHKEEELTMMDFAACGYPDLSYHGREAWRLSADRLGREAGVMYCGRYARIDRATEDDFFYIAYNMHWEEKVLALPDLPAGMHWEKVMDSAEASVCSDGTVIEKKIPLQPRSIAILKSFGRMPKKGKQVESVTAF